MAQKDFIPDNDFYEDEDGGFESCPHCNTEYDEIDYEYQICSLCGYNANNENTAEDEDDDSDDPNDSRNL